MEKTKEEMSEELKGKEDHIAHLMSEISQHQNICSDLASELQSLQKSMEQVSGEFKADSIEFSNLLFIFHCMMCNFFVN